MDSPSPLPIAIVGMSCRFPGSANTLDKLWQLCANACNTWSKWPKDRLNEAAFFHPRPEHLGTFHSQGGHFLKEDVSRHDASFFNFTADTAKAMDPQIRILLETVFESFESAGIPLEQAAGSQCSVFAGAMFRDYHDILMKDTENLDRYFLTGTTPAMTANRISHFFDLRGGSVTVDTACSTTLTALHLACQSLRSGETNMAVVGGANLLLHPGASIGLSNLSLTGPGGKSYGFDSRAEGYGRGEGIASIVIKRLPDALRDGDPIRAVIRETGFNQDGRTPTITSPSQQAQEDLIRSCYQRVGLHPKDTAYVEAHGTGTIAGDTIEVKALGSVFGEGRSERDPLLIGSIKANLGHLESTSGLAAILKVVLMLEREEILPHAMIETPNPDINFTSLKVQVPTRLMPWPTNKPLRASISNFGAGGTNTHVIIEHVKYHVPSPRLVTRVMEEGHTNVHQDSSVPMEHLPGQNGDLNGQESRSDSNASRNKPRDTYLRSERRHSFVFTISAKEENSLNASMTALGEHLESIDSSWTIQDLAYTLTQRRSNFPWRVAVPASSISELKVALTNSIRSPVQMSQASRLGFVFTGQGATWHAMGRELIFAYPVFAKALDEADDCVRLLGASWSVRDELLKCKERSRLSNPQFSFPLTVIIQLALVRLLLSWGITPTATTGHSSGEIPAAYAAGIVDFNEAIAIAYIRGRLTSMFVESGKLSGGMTAVAVGKEKATEYIQNLKSGRAVIGCVNSPSSVTISGDVCALEEIEKQAMTEQIFARRLKVPAAYHSPQMKLLAKDYHSQLEPHLKESYSTKSKVAIFSPVTGRHFKSTNSIRTAKHWVDNMVQCVQFEDALTEMIRGSDLYRSTSQASNIDVIIEIGPHGTLQSPIRQTIGALGLKNLRIDVWSCLSRDKDSIRAMQELAGVLYCRGFPVNLNAVNFPHGDQGVRVIHNLPSYQWNHSARYWAESSLARDMLQREHARHDLLGARVEGSNPNHAMWRNTIRVADLPWLQDHVLQSEILYPGAGLMVMVIEALHQLDSSTDYDMGYAITDIELVNGMVIPDNQQGLETQLIIRNSSHQLLSPGITRNFSIFSRSRSGEWTEHCRGKASTVKHPLSAKHAPLATNLTPVNIKHFYEYLESYGPTLGRSFQNIISLEGGNTEARATVAVPEIGPMMPTPSYSDSWIHPTTLDACFQAAWAAVPKNTMRRLGLCIPNAADSLYVESRVKVEPGCRLAINISLAETSYEGFEITIGVFKLDGPEHKLVIKAEGLKFLSLSRGQTKENAYQTMLLEPVWRPDISFFSDMDFHSWIPATRNQAEAKIFKDLQVATINIIQDTLQQFTPEDETLLTGHFRKLVAWMRRSLKDHFSSYGVHDEKEKRNLYDEVTATSINGKMLGLLRQNLQKFLRKEANPLEIMLRDGFLYDYYANAIKFTRCLDYVEKYMSLFGHKYPQARILEIGAGTGCCTTAVIKGLTRGSREPLMVGHYDITDISLGFFETLQEKYHKFSNQMGYQALDIEQEPTLQGFDAGRYDLVIACIVLHATRNLNRTMANIRRLLKLGGKVLIVETTKPHLDQSLAFGLFEGWWLSEEDDREWSPLRSTEQWETILTETGFSKLDTVLNDSDCVAESNYSMMVATAIDHVNRPPPVSPSAISLIDLGSDGNVSREGYQKLTQSLQDLTGNIVTVGQIGNVSLQGKICILFSAAAGGTLVNLSSEKFETLKAMVQEADEILWISKGATVEGTNPEEALHIGLLRTLRLEHGGKRFISLDLDCVDPWWSDNSAKVICAVFQSTLGSSRQEIADYEFSLRFGKVMVSRMFGNSALNNIFIASDVKPQLRTFSFSDPYMFMEVATPGLLDSLVFKEVTPGPDLSEQTHNMIEIQPHFFGLNFRDVYVAMGQMKEKWVGLECAGYISKVSCGVPGTLKVGDRVCALLQAGHLANKVWVPSTSVVPLSENMSFEIGASIPIIFVTAYHALINIANVEAGESVLIHSAAGGFGQAAIAIASYRGAEIFATVGSESKRTFLTQTYNIPEDHIFSSRDASFAANIMNATRGKGVDIVLNSLSGPLLQAGWDCVSDLGRFIELGKRDAQLNKYLEMKHFKRSVMYAAVDTVRLALQKPKTLSTTFHNVMDLFKNNKVIHQIPITTYEISEVHQAFRKLQGGIHIGKIVVRVQEGQQILAVPRTKLLRFDPDSTYLVVGGLKGIGREIARWMARNGARHLTLISRSAESLPTADLEADVRASGAELLICNCDITNKIYLEQVLNRCQQISGRKIRGIIQAAMDLQDSVFSNMTHEQWMNSIRPKVDGTRNLSDMFQSPPGASADALDFFVILSSATGIIGSIGQANYTAAATYQDALALYRIRKGLPTVSIDLGSVLSVGVAARTEGVYERLARAGYRAHDVSDVLRIVEVAILHPEKVQGQLVAGIAPFIAPGDLAWRHEPRFAGSKLPADSEGTSSQPSGPTYTSILKDRLSKARALGNIPIEILIEALQGRMSEMLDTAASDIDPDKSLLHYGVDSLVAVELRNWLSVNVTPNISIFDITQSSSIRGLAERVAEKVLSRSDKS